MKSLLTILKKELLEFVRDLIPGLRYSKIAPITQCGR